MNYTFNKNDIYQMVEREVSMAADAANDQSGVSLYDQVVLTEKDRPFVEGLVDEAAASLIRRFSDIFVQDESTTATRTLTFDIPDFDTRREPELFLIPLFLALNASNGVFMQRAAALVPEYTQRAQAALDNLETLLRSRTAPAR